MQGQTRAPGHTWRETVGLRSSARLLAISLRVSAKTETLCIALTNAPSGCAFAFVKGQTTALGHTWRDQVLAVPLEFQRQLRQPGRRTGTSIPSAAWHRSSASRHSIHAPHLQSRRRSERAAGHCPCGPLLRPHEKLDYARQPQLAMLSDTSCITKVRATGPPAGD